MIAGLLTLCGIKFHDTIHAATDGAFREARGTKEAQPVETMEKAFATMESERFRLAQDRPQVVVASPRVGCGCIPSSRRGRNQTCWLYCVNTVMGGSSFLSGG